MGIVKKFLLILSIAIVSLLFVGNSKSNLTLAQCDGSSASYCDTGTWKYYYGARCEFFGYDEFGNPVYAWAFNFKQCDAGDVCQGEQGLRAGLCTNDGCGVGGIYKWCCNSTYTGTEQCTINSSGYDVCPGGRTASTASGCNSGSSGGGGSGGGNPSCNYTDSGFKRSACGGIPGIQTCSSTQKLEYNLYTSSTCNDDYRNKKCRYYAVCDTSAPSCTVTLSPSSANLSIGSGSKLFTATVSNFQNGTAADITSVDFKTGGSGNITTSPTSDTSVDYQTNVTPLVAGNDTLIADVKMPRTDGTIITACSATANVTIVNDPAPDCANFQTLTTTTAGVTKTTVSTDITDVSGNIVRNGSFETGNTNYWTYQDQLSEWRAIPMAEWYNPGADGAYYSKINGLDNANNPYTTTEWIETGSDLSGKTYTLEFITRAQDAGTTGYTGNILIQRFPFNGDWTDTTSLVGQVPVTSSRWNAYKYTLTFPNPSNGSNTSKIRVVLAPSYGAPPTVPIYFDNIRLSPAGSGGVDNNSVKFYYKDSTANGCTNGVWTQINVPQSNITQSGDNYSTTLNTSALLPNQSYDIVVNASDINGNGMTGNTDGSCSSGLTYRANCSTTFTCVPNCGGTTGCGDTGATPSTVTQVLVNGGTLSGAVDLTNSDLITVSWTDPGTSLPQASDEYAVYVYNKSSSINTPSISNCTTANKCKRYTTTTTSVQFNADPTFDSDVYIVVEAINNTCSASTGTTTSQTSPIPYNFVADISGSFYSNANVTQNTFPFSCSPSGPSTLTDMSGNSSSVTNDQNSIADTILDTTYTLNDVPYAPDGNWINYPINPILNIGTNTLVCSCPSLGLSTCTQVDTAAPSTGKDFYITDLILTNGPWWQAIGGNVYSKNLLTSTIPGTCGPNPNCSANIITNNSAGDSNSAGIPVTGNSVISSETGSYTEHSPVAKALSTTYNGNKEDYAFFAKEADLNNAQQITANTINSLPTGATPDSDRTEIYYRNGNLTIDFSGSSQTVTAVEKKIIFVNGDITFVANKDENMLTVDQGGYIAFIATGDINFDPNIGNTVAFGTPGSSTPNIAGVFIADRTINIQGYSDAATKDNKFVGEGTFVGWSGINLNRDFDNTTSITDKAINNTNPIEVFSFRPDFNINTPKIMKRPNLVWQEVN